jgi:hypothetical protein
MTLCRIKYIRSLYYVRIYTHVRKFLTYCLSWCIEWLSSYCLADYRWPQESWQWHQYYQYDIWTCAIHETVLNTSLIIDTVLCKHSYINVIGWCNTFFTVIYVLRKSISTVTCFLSVIALSIISFLFYFCEHWALKENKKS